MGKKVLPSSSSNPSSDSPFSSPTTHNHELPRMDPPPPYDAITSSPRSSISSSVRSVDRLDPDGTVGNTEVAESRLDGGEQGGSAEAPTPTPENSNANKNCDMKDQDGGCLNYGKNVNGCMNYGDGSDGCLNYESKDGCMNYKSTGGCMNYEVDGDWEGNEGCMNYRRGGGCLLAAD